MTLPESAKKIIELLSGAGYKAYAVGGCVRDDLLGKEMHDVDICTSATPSEVESVLEKNGVRFIETGLKHGTVTAVIEHTPYEITTFRTDGEYLDNRRPEKVEFITDVKQDLARRDFTVNALAYNDDEGVIDCFGGVEDLKNGIIRAVGDADKRFNEDALRIMRALRFSAVLGFEIEENTQAALFRNKELLKNIANERIYTELVKLLLGDYCEDVLLKYSEIICVILPELKSAVGCAQNSKWHIYDVYTHSVKTVTVTPEKDYMRLAALLHDCAKPECKTTDEKGDHFYNHAAVGAEKTEAALRRLRASNAVLLKTVKLIEMHNTDLSEKPSKLKALMRKLGAELTFDLIELNIADLKTHNPALAEPEIDGCERIKKQIKLILDNNEPYLISHLEIGGNDLVALGYGGAEISAELERLIHLVSGDKTLNVREKLLKYAENDYKRLKEC